MFVVNDSQSSFQVIVGALLSYDLLVGTKERSLDDGINIFLLNFNETFRYLYICT